MIENLNWAKMNNLIPAIIQHADSGQVLMLGYMNPQALEQTRQTRMVTFYSRSKKRLWVKGEHSGNYLQLVSMQLDCDGDALLILALPQGPTCHTGAMSCFNTEQTFSLHFLLQLEQIIQHRTAADDSSSYTRSLLESGIKRIAQKVGEEGVEVALAALAGTSQELLAESADLLFHLLLLLQAKGCNLQKVLRVLQNRNT